MHERTTIVESDPESPTYHSNRKTMISKGDQKLFQVTTVSRKGEFDGAKIPGFREERKPQSDLPFRRLHISVHSIKRVHVFVQETWIRP